MDKRFPPSLSGGKMQARIGGSNDCPPWANFVRRAMHTRLVVFPILLLPIYSSINSAATLNLSCSYDHTVDARKGTQLPAAGQLSAQIQFSEENVTAITVSKGEWCDPNGAFVSDTEISFACGLDLAGQRISYSFTLNRVNGALEQRFFVGGKLAVVQYGHCKIAELQF